MDSSGSLFLLYAGSTLGTATILGLVGYNLLGLFRYLKQPSPEEAASTLAVTAWALSFVAFLCGPCSWVPAGCTAVLIRVERRRMYEERSSLAGATPLRLASVNVVLTLVQWLLFSAALATAWPTAS